MSEILLQEPDAKDGRFPPIMVRRSCQWAKMQYRCRAYRSCRHWRLKAMSSSDFEIVISPQDSSWNHSYTLQTRHLHLLWHVSGLHIHLLVQNVHILVSIDQFIMQRWHSICMACNWVRSTSDNLICKRHSCACISGATRLCLSVTNLLQDSLTKCIFWNSTPRFHAWLRSSRHHPLISCL